MNNPRFSCPSQIATKKGGEREREKEKDWGKNRDGLESHCLSHSDGYPVPKSYASSVIQCCTAVKSAHTSRAGATCDRWPSQDAEAVAAG